MSEHFTYDAARELFTGYCTGPCQTLGGIFDDKPGIGMVCRCCYKVTMPAVEQDIAVLINETLSKVEK